MALVARRDDADDTTADFGDVIALPFANPCALAARGHRFDQMRHGSGRLAGQHVLTRDPPHEHADRASVGFAGETDRCARRHPVIRPSPPLLHNAASRGHAECDRSSRASETLVVALGFLAAPNPTLGPSVVPRPTGAAVVYTVDGTIAASETATLTNAATAVVGAPANDPDTTNNTASIDASPAAPDDTVFANGFDPLA